MIAIVGECLVAPLTPLNPRGLHLRDFFEQQLFEVFNQFLFLLSGPCALFAVANEASMYYRLRSVKRINKVYMKAM